MPDMFLHFGGTHVHHLNYGIFLLSTIAGVLLFASLNQTQKDFCALIYGVAMALTFDEFGMWLHLGGSYWQRASFDAVIVLLSLLALLAFAPRWQRIRTQHFVVIALVLLLVAGFSVLLVRSLDHAQEKYWPRLIEIEKNGPG